MEFYLQKDYVSGHFLGSKPQYAKRTYSNVELCTTVCIAMELYS